MEVDIPAGSSNALRFCLIFFGFTKYFRTFYPISEKTEFLWAFLDTNRTAESIPDSYDPERFASR